jgi:hypothetical protein
MLMGIEYSHQLIITLFQQELQPYAETELIVSVGTEEVLVLIMGEWQDGFDNSFETHYEPQIIII